MWLGDRDDMEPVEKFCEDHMNDNPDLLLYTSTRGSGHFAKNFTDCVFVQLRKDILSKGICFCRINLSYYSKTSATKS